MLTNQEHAMKEYLRRQQVKNPENLSQHLCCHQHQHHHGEHCQLQVEAEKHIRQYSPGPVRRAEVKQSPKVKLVLIISPPLKSSRLVTAE